MVKTRVKTRVKIVDSLIGKVCKIFKQIIKWS